MRAAFRLVGARPRVFFGWWIVLASGWLSMLGSGFFYYGLGTFFLPLTNEFGWSRTLTSSAFSLHRLEGGIIAPVVGVLFDKLGPRKLVLAGVTLAGLGFVILSATQSFAGFVAAVLVMSAGFSSGFSGISMATVANWFVRKRTLALGLLMAGAGAGGVLVPFLAWLIEASGWRTAALIVGLLIWLCGWPLSFVMRHRPEDHGLLPDGDHLDSKQTDPARSAARGVAKAERSLEVDVGAREALRSRAFWFIALSATLTMTAQSAVMVHVIPHIVSLGMPSTLAAIVVAVLTVGSIVGRIGFGWLGDRFQKRYVMAACFALQMAGLAVMASATEPWHLIPFLILYAPSYGGAIPLRPAVVGEYFGRKSFGAIQGLTMGCSSLGAMLGPIVAGAMYDLFGSYRLAFWILAVVAVSSAPAILALPRPPGREDQGAHLRRQAASA